MSDADGRLLKASQQNSQTHSRKADNTLTICHPLAACGADLHTDYSAVVRKMLNV